MDNDRCGGYGGGDELEMYEGYLREVDAREHGGLEVGTRKDGGLEVRTRELGARNIGDSGARWRW